MDTVTGGYNRWGTSMFRPPLLIHVPEQLALCAVLLHTACAAPELRDFVAPGLNAYTITPPRPSAGKLLTLEIIAFPLCVTTPKAAALPLLLEALQIAGAFFASLPLYKRGRQRAWLPQNLQFPLTALCQLETRPMLENS